MFLGIAAAGGAWLLKLADLGWADPGFSATPESEFVPEVRVAENLRLLLILPGLLFGAVSLLLRFNSHWPVAYVAALPRRTRSLASLALALVFASVFITLSGSLVLRIAGHEWIAMKPGSLFVVWLIAAPASAVACRVAWRNLSAGEMPPNEESALLLALAALVCGLSCWAIAWDTIQLLLAVMTFVALVASPLMVISQPARRLVVSLLVVLHFAGMTTAVLAVPPLPWVFGQLWTRIYRPYLEFMYLANAYHYYSPEPGPASYLWFRLIYLDDKHKEHGVWYKVPDFDERGRPTTTLSLQYNRLLALTENITHGTPQTGNFEVVKEGDNVKVVPTRAVEQRSKYAPGYKPALGQAGPPAGSLLIPFHPLLPPQQQYIVPYQNVKELIASYAKHVCRLPHPEHPDWAIVAAKVYKIVHQIPPEGPFINGVDPTEPYFYRPYFYGEFSPDGLLLEPNSPFLYWLLPILEDNEGRIFDYARRHAGDPKWVREPPLWRRPGMSSREAAAPEWVTWPDPK